jgi:Tol biopolymer transport system component/PKD repeat protein
MKFRLLMGITAIAIGALLAPAQPAAGQTAPGTVGRIAYEYCYFYSWDFDDYYCTVGVRAEGIDTAVAATGSSPKWSPDGSRVVFVGGYGESNIQVLNLADLTVFTLTNDAALDLAPAWSPDGATIAFVSHRTGRPELYRMHEDGTGLVRLTTAIGFNGRFAWSPDGRTIALAREVAGETNLYSIRADGSGMARLTSGVGGVGGFDWSSDSSRIVFDCATDVCLINADATGLARLTTSSGRGAVFAPGDGRIAFVTTAFGQAAEIAVRHADGTIVRVAAGTPGTDPIWSPDGASLLFEGRDPVGYAGCCANGCNADTVCTLVYGLYRVNADGSNLQLLLTGGNADWWGTRPGQPLASFTHQCAGSRCDFDASGSSDPDGAIASYSWQFGDGTTSTGSTASHTYFPGGTFIVRLTVTDDAGLTNAANKTIVANAAPTASFVANCAAGICTFDASGSADVDGTIASYEWSFGDGVTLSQPSGTATATHIYRTGTFAVQLLVRDNGGAGATASATVQTLNKPPVASFTKTCEFFRCTFNASASADPEGRALRGVFWNFGDGGIVSGAAIQEHTYPGPGTYRIVLTVADDALQQATVEDTVSIQPAPIHVGDLDGTSTQTSRQSTVTMSVLVHDAGHRPVPSATVIGLWSSRETGVCTTDGTGRCTFSAALRGNLAGASLTIQTVQHVLYLYGGVNHDPDGDSNGTTFSFKKK